MSIMSQWLYLWNVKIIVSKIMSMIHNINVDIFVFLFFVGSNVRKVFRMGLVITKYIYLYSRGVVSVIKGIDFWWLTISY